MSPAAIRDILRIRPFEPIRIHLSDGSHYDVRHSELMLVTKLHVGIAFNLDDDDMPQRSAWIDPKHIAHIVPINGNQDESGSNG